MALWLRENNLLTVQGKEILSKLQAGIGKMEIVKVVSGAGYVNSFDIENQTDVTDPRLEFSIISKETTTQGSGLELRLDNLGVTTEYPLYQIGVYVTHTDYKDASDNLIPMLYMLAQSSTSYPDLVPAFTDMPIILSYSIWLYHTDLPSTDMVNINISMPGYIPMYMRGNALGVSPLNLNRLVPDEHLPIASEVRKGIVQIATEGEIETGSAPNKAVSAFELQKYVSRLLSSGTFVPLDHADITDRFGASTVALFGHIRIASEAEVKDGNDNTKAVTPYLLRYKMTDIWNALYALSGVQLTGIVNTYAELPNPSSLVQGMPNYHLVLYDETHLDENNVPQSSVYKTVGADWVFERLFTIKLDNLDASGLTSGTIDDARLSSNVVLLDNTQTITGRKTFTAKIMTLTPTTLVASINLPHGVAPATPDNGDVWTTNTGVFVRINGVTHTLATTNTAQSISGDKTISGNFICNGLTITPTELSYLDGLTGNINDRLSALEPVTDLTTDDGTKVLAASMGYKLNQEKVAKSGDTMGGRLNANASAVATIANAQVRNIYAGTGAMTAGSTPLTTGDIYLQYE